MKNIVGVRFKKPGKIYFFDANNFTIEKGSFVIVETVNGYEYGEVVIANRQLPEEKIVNPLKKVIRIATKNINSITLKYYFISLQMEELILGN